MMRDKIIRINPLYAGLLTLVTCLLLTLSYGVIAEEEGKKRTKTKITSTIRLPLQKKLEEAQTLSEEKRFDESIEVLDNALENTSRLTNFEKFQLKNFKGYMYYQLEKHDLALDEYQAISRYEGIDPRFIEDVYFTIGQLFHLLERPQESLKVMLQLEKITTNKQDSFLLIFIGQLYFQLENLPKGLPYVEKALKFVKNLRPPPKSDGEPYTEAELRKLRKPKKSWFQLLRAYYQQLKQYQNMLKNDFDMVAYYPDDDTLAGLASSLGFLGRNKDRLSILELIYERGYFDNPKKEQYIVLLANLLMTFDTPYKAAVILEDAMFTRKTVNSEKKSNLMTLSQAWSAAREDKKSIPYLSKAAEISENGKEYILLAERYANLYEWKKVGDAVRKGIAKGGLNNVIGSKILLGTSLLETGKLVKGKSLFENINTDLNRAIVQLDAKIKLAKRVKLKDRNYERINKLEDELDNVKRQKVNTGKYITYAKNRIESEAYLNQGG